MRPSALKPVICPASALGYRVASKRCSGSMPLRPAGCPLWLQPRVLEQEELPLKTA